jgi:DNA-binding protein HU-beta
MYKTELMRRVANETRLSRRIVSDVLNQSLRLIEHALREGQSVTFTGFGTFLTRERGEGQVRDVRTGEMVSYPARRIAAFRVGDVLKRAVRGERRRGAPRRRRAEAEE